MHFPGRNVCSLIQISPQLVPKGSTDNKSALISVMAWASYQIRKTAGCACVGNAGNIFPCRRLQSKPLVSDPDMHHGTSVTHVPWCMSRSLTHGDGENVRGVPGGCAPTILPGKRPMAPTPLNQDGDVNDDAYMSHQASMSWRAVLL